MWFIVGLEWILEKDFVQQNGGGSKKRGMVEGYCMCVTHAPRTIYDLRITKRDKMQPSQCKMCTDQI